MPTQHKPQPTPLTTEELARRMLAMPFKPRSEMVKKKAKPPAKKK
jgi:hypothetical protein